MNKETHEESATERLINNYRKVLSQHRLHAAEMVRRGLTARAERGWISTTPPLGYLNNRTKKVIVKDPENWGRVQLLWRYVIENGCSVSIATNYADNTLNLRSRHGNPLSCEAVRRMLSNPFYMGKFWYSGKLYQGSHQPMVTEPEFNMVQQILAANSKEKRPTK